MDEFLKKVLIITKDLNLPDGFLPNLLDEDDWSFIIKTHFLLEGAMAYLLTKATGKEELYETFVEMDMNSRIEASKRLGVLNSDLRRYLRALSNLRNKLIHRITHAEFSFEEYFKDKNSRKNFIDNFGQWVPDLENYNGEAISNNNFAIEKPLVTIYLGLLFVLNQVCLVKHDSE